MMKFWQRLRFSRVEDRRVGTQQAWFDSEQAPRLSSIEQLQRLQPAVTGCLAGALGVEALASRMCPVRLVDGQVAIFALEAHVGSDQAGMLAHQLLAAGYSLAQPSRYRVSSAVLLAVVRQTTGSAQAQDTPQAPISKGVALMEVFDDMLAWGLAHQASDIHINLLADAAHSDVRFSIAGRYVAPERFDHLPTSMLSDMLAVAWMDIKGGNGAVFDPRIEQQGSMVKQIAGKALLVRWASLAAGRGASVCLRLLRRDTSADDFSLDTLGYLPEQVALLDACAQRRGGAIVFAGTVGAGKSTSLAAMMTRLSRERKLVTLEDPVEYLIPYAIQNTLSRDLQAQGDEAYLAKLRTLKRSGMDDVLLGEIRDQASGRAFMDIASAGISLYTTVHAARAALIPERLASDFIGVSRDFLATPGVLKLLVHQALVPGLCQACAWSVGRLFGSRAGVDPVALSSRRWFQALADTHGCDLGRMRVRNPEGCSACRAQGVNALYGYAGRTLVAETLVPDHTPKFLSAIARRRPRRYQRLLGAPGFSRACRADWVRHGVLSGMAKVMAGQIDPRDLDAFYGLLAPMPSDQAAEPMPEQQASL